jgi:type VI secretion system protein ImpJ
LINTPKIHPWYAFGALHELASELTSFTVKVSLLSIDVKDHVLSSKYDHFDCAKGILQTKDLIMQLLTEIAVSDEMNVSCERKENSGEFRAVIPERFLSFKSRFYITIITKENPDEWLADFEIYTRIASSITISDIVSRSLPGLSVKHFQDTPPGLPVRQNASYFLVEQSGGVWESVFSSRTAVILWNEAPEDAQIDISVIGA